ncbi:uncharacterized protein LOC132196864 [Neocloeon triangulifer]|uniref:uncharacterized protein LOC132196864 n=1 Tax=Neocloeon triangulifer TaxID=2078957 RepID=UPI00286EBD75|nr:uncharacterized protein LOC132196864 [Neocloeon triangulifer]
MKMDRILKLLLLWIFGVSTTVGQKDEMLYESPLYVINVSGITKVAIHRSRVFVLVPSQEVPLLEMSWLPHVQHVAKLRKTPVNASVRRCQGLVRPVDLQTDPYGRLWLLDAGDAKCAPKLVVYDILYHRLVENARHSFDLGLQVEHLTIDPGATRGVTLAYVAGGDKILVYSYYQDRHWNVKTVLNETITGIALNPGDAEHRTTLLVLVNHLTVYQIFTSRLLEGSAGVIEAGELMGPSLAGLTSDGRGGVFYMLSRDFVAVRWNSRLPLQAENQEILLQSDRVLFNVTSFVTDSNRNIWGVVNNGTDQMTWCAKLTFTSY